MRTLNILVVSLLLLVISCQNTDTKQSKNIIEDPLVFLNSEIEQQPENYQLYAQRASLFLEQGKLDPAFRDLSKALEINPDDAGLYVILADIYFVMGNKDNSISALKKAIKLNPESEIPLTKLAELYLLTGEYDKSIFFADRSLIIDVNNAEPYYYKGMALLETYDTANAILNLKIASNIDTNNYSANMQLGAVYYHVNDSISEIYLKSAIKNQPDDASAHYYLGMLYQENGDFEKALETYSQLFNNKKGSKRAYYNSGYIYLVEIKQFPKAVEMFTEAVALNPAFVEAVYNLGRSYEAMGDFDSARTQYQNAIKILPNYPLAVRGLNRLD